MKINSRYGNMYYNIITEEFIVIAEKQYKAKLLTNFERHIKKKFDLDNTPFSYFKGDSHQWGLRVDN